jgi:hypothetical protein
MRAGGWAYTGAGQAGGPPTGRGQPPGPQPGAPWAEPPASASRAPNDAANSASLRMVGDSGRGARRGRWAGSGKEKSKPAGSLWETGPVSDSGLSLV